jgi:hypothetical protein
MFSSPALLVITSEEPYLQELLGDFLVRVGQCELDLAVSFVTIRDKLEHGSEPVLGDSGSLRSSHYTRTTTWQYHP